MLNTISQQQVVLKAAEELKTVIKMPDWAMFVKTGAQRETMPRNPDWWYIRAASILRVCHVRGPVGVQKLRTRYGGNKNRGMKPNRFALASGKVIRAILQQLEEAGLVKQVTIETHKGRIATPTGKSLLIKVAKKIEAENKKEAIAAKKAQKIADAEAKKEAKVKEEAKDKKTNEQNAPKEDQ